MRICARRNSFKYQFNFALWLHRPLPCTVFGQCDYYSIVVAAAMFHSQNRALSSVGSKPPLN